MNNILITGGCGFVGFNFIQLLVSCRNYKLFCVDSITEAARYQLVDKINYFKKHSIDLLVADVYSDKKQIENYIFQNGIDTIVHFAAESHVDNCNKYPNVCFNTNINGTINMLDLAKKYNLRYHQIVTSEVYGSCDPQYDNVDENFPFHTNSPYSSSKASGDMIVQSYYKTYGTRVTLTRCPNNFGPYQHPEKLLPKVIINAYKDIKIPVYGDGKQIRYWIYVDEHNKAVLDVLEKSQTGKVYNIEPSTKESYITNIDLIRIVLDYLGKKEDLIEYVQDRPAHNKTFTINGQKLRDEIGWHSTIDFKQSIYKTIDWYIQKHDLHR